MTIIFTTSSLILCALLSNNNLPISRSSILAKALLLFIFSIRIYFPSSNSVLKRSLLHQISYHSASQCWQNVQISSLLLPCCHTTRDWYRGDRKCLDNIDTKYLTNNNNKKDGQFQYFSLFSKIRLCHFSITFWYINSLLVWMPLRHSLWDHWTCEN